MYLGGQLGVYLGVDLGVYLGVSSNSPRDLQAFHYWEVPRPSTYYIRRSCLLRATISFHHMQSNKYTPPPTSAA